MKECYKLDYLNNAFGKNNKPLPDLTQKNIEFIDAIINLDSNYNRDTDPNNGKDEDFNLELGLTKSQNKFCGATPYWFKQMNDGMDYKTCLTGAIIAIDRTNSTHLMACEDGRRKIRDLIFNEYPTLDSLKKALNQNFHKDKENHLIGKLTRELPAAGKPGKTRFNLSFATKFCSAAAFFLETKSQYPKYDNIVSDNLPYYEMALLSKTVNVNHYKIDHNKGLSHRLDIYEEYLNTIENIISKNKTPITINQFDMIVWYVLK